MNKFASLQSNSEARTQLDRIKVELFKASYAIHRAKSGAYQWEIWPKGVGRTGGYYSLFYEGWGGGKPMRWWMMSPNTPDDIKRIVEGSVEEVMQ